MGPERNGGGAIQKKKGDRRSQNMCVERFGDIVGCDKKGGPS